MNENVDKSIEALASKMMNETTLESPSLDFTANIMAQVEALSQKKDIVYKPLISKWFWVAFFVGIALLFGFFFSGNNPETTSWFDVVDYSILFNNIVTETLSNIRVSKTMLYSIVLFGVMLFIQIPILKNYFDKRLEV